MMTRKLIVLCGLLIATCFVSLNSTPADAAWRGGWHGGWRGGYYGGGYGWHRPYYGGWRRQMYYGYGYSPYYGGGYSPYGYYYY